MTGLVLRSRPGRAGSLVAAASVVALGGTLLAPATASAVVAPAHASSTAASAPAVRAATALPTLRRGSTGSRVTWVQRTLGVAQTGYFGSRTYAAVVRFQKTHRISPANGVVAATTWTALKRYAASRAASTVASPAPSTGDPTMTSAARTSRTARQALGVSAFAGSAHARMIVKRESGGRCTAVSPNGTYRGKWQMNSAFWRSYGGTSFATTADRATCAQQDLVAYRGWIASWWNPWGG